MKKLFLLILCLGAVQAMALEPLYEIKLWRKLSHRRVSRLGRRAMKAGGAGAVHAESPHFIAHGARKDDLDRAIRKAEYAYAESGRYLKLDPSPRKAHLFV